jgi:hypothetical protein
MAYKYSMNNYLVTKQITSHLFILLSLYLSDLNQPNNDMRMTCPYNAEDIARKIQNISIESRKDIVETFEPPRQGRSGAGRRLLGLMHSLVAKRLQLVELEM